MFTPFERTIALRYLRSKRRDAFISFIAGFSILGIILGVSTLIIVMSVMNGFREDLLSRILGFNGHLALYSPQNKGLKNYDLIKLSLKDSPFIASITPLIKGQSMIAHRGKGLGVYVQGISYSDLKNRQLISGNIKLGSLISFNTIESPVVVGVRLAEQLRVIPGDTITLISPEGNATAFGIIPRQKRFKIVAIFDVGMSDYNTSFIFIPLTQAQSFFRFSESVTALEIFLKNPHQIARAKADITSRITTPVRVLDWQEENSVYFGAIQVERNVMFIILTLILIVAAFNIIASLFMLVKDKSKDIAVMRTMGATRKTMLKIFVLTGTILGAIGTVVGVILGLALALNIETIRQILQGLTGTQLFSPEIYFLSQLPAKVEVFEVITISVMALILSFIATLYPAWRAAKLDPVEVLRYE